MKTALFLIDPPDDTGWCVYCQKNVPVRKLARGRETKTYCLECRKLLSTELSEIKKEKK